VYILPWCSCLLSTHTDRQGVDISFTVCLFVSVILFVCTVTDFSDEDKDIGVKFCTVVRRRLGVLGRESPILENCSPRSPKSDESAIHQMGRAIVIVTLQMRRSWNCAACGHRSACVDIRPYPKADVLVLIFLFFHANKMTMMMMMMTTLKNYRLAIHVFSASG